jgi:hypothetical protein
VIGHEHVIAQRKRGLAPAFVVLNCTRICPQWGIDKHGSPWINVDPTENPDRLDLRFLNGLTVGVFTDSAERRDALEHACRMAGATIPEVEDGAMA